MNVHMRANTPKITPLLAIAIEGLVMRVRGRIVTPEESDYDDIRGLAHSNWDQRPLFVARVVDAADVADVVDFARRHQLEIAVRSGGHSVCGYSGSEGGVVIDLRDLNGLDLDMDDMSVWAGSGLTAGQVTKALDEHGVAIGFGDSATVGIGGLTLGGGVGYLTRKLGLTIDSLIAAEIVTASGNILTINETSHPELFWAVRGGGGNFGVVTRFRYRLNPLPEFVGGPLILPATAENLAGFVAAAKLAPDELTTILLAMPAPPLPFIPPHLVGQTVLMGMMAYAGSVADAQAALAPFRGLTTPIADLVRPGPYGMMYMPEDPSMKPTLSVRTLFKSGIDVAEAAEILARLGQCSAPMRLAQIRILGGAAGRVPAEATAYAHRDADLLIGFMAMDGSAEAAARHDIWATGCVSALGGATRGTYVNFLAEEGPEALRASYTSLTWQRLQEVKRRYDPTNLFRRNQNISPA
ncbi:FAD-binding oxidoreductase [Devosia rhizoryzae]|uniref:FAD-binding oxidoreductase n=1 Tax=Devosia rhizoryzae TaxID=2774137 RepID=A0ABX7CDG9_9HYPH|nr:FAD-binding oxidoreductase [Devosia rhizoryzae]QQR40001.1 FAD-binding oxidoreductase [Devosia rhizoryzae]